MQFLAFKRFGNWFFEEFREMWGDLGSLLTTGMLVFAARAFFKVVGLFIETDIGVIAVLVSFVLWQLMTGFVWSALYSAAKARLHDRRPRFGDMMSDPLVILNAVGGQFLCGVVANLPLLILGMPAIIIIAGIFAAAGQQNPGGALAAATAVTVVLGAIGVGLSFLISTLFIFVIPLVVDKRVNFIKAIAMSARMAVRDYFGLLFFQVVWTVVYVPSMAFGLCLCGGFPFAIAIIEPALIGVKLRAYRDYFGMDRDWMLEESLYVEGYHELVRDLQEERASSVIGYSRSIYDKSPPGAAYPAPQSSVTNPVPIPTSIPPPKPRPATQSPAIPPPQSQTAPPSSSSVNPNAPSSGGYRVPPPPGGGVNKPPPTGQ